MCGYEPGQPAEHGRPPPVTGTCYRHLLPAPVAGLDDYLQLPYDDNITVSSDLRPPARPRDEGRPCGRVSVLVWQPRSTSCARTYVERLAELDPVSATARGIVGYDDKMTDYSPEGIAARTDLDRTTLTELGGLKAGERPRPHRRRPIFREASGQLGPRRRRGNDAGAAHNWQPVPRCPQRFRPHASE